MKNLHQETQMPAGKWAHALNFWQIFNFSGLDKVNEKKKNSSAISLFMKVTIPGTNGNGTHCGLSKFWWQLTLDISLTDPWTYAMNWAIEGLMSFVKTSISFWNLIDTEIKASWGHCLVKKGLYSESRLMLSLVNVIIRFMWSHFKVPLTKA